MQTLHELRNCKVQIRNNAINPYAGKIGLVTEITNIHGLSCAKVEVYDTDLQIEQRKELKVVTNAKVSRKITFIYNLSDLKLIS